MRPLKDAGYEQLVANIREEADRILHMKVLPAETAEHLYSLADGIASGRWGNNPLA